MRKDLGPMSIVCPYKIVPDPATTFDSMVTINSLYPYPASLLAAHHTRITSIPMTSIPMTSILRILLCTEHTLTQLEFGSISLRSIFGAFGWISKVGIRLE